MLLAVIPRAPALFAGRTGIHFFEPDNQNWIPASFADKAGDGPGMTKRKSA